LDVVIRLPGVDHQEDKKRTLFQLSAALMKSGVTMDVHVNHFARVPVVTFQTLPNFGAFPYLINRPLYVLG
jgi:non-canonical poly(A) RNA polymerase PAPD5/7